MDLRIGEFFFDFNPNVPLVDRSFDVPLEFSFVYFTRAFVVEEFAVLLR